MATYFYGYPTWRYRSNYMFNEKGEWRTSIILDPDDGNVTSIGQDFVFYGKS